MTLTLLRIYLKQYGRNGSFKQQGFALPLAMGLGLVMLVLGVSTIMVAQSDRSTAFQRRETGASFAVAEGGIARVLAQLTQKNNAVLLTRNYDTLNPKTNQTYLGTDGVPNSGDEETNLVNEWSTYSATPSACMPTPGAPPSITYTDTSTTGTYTLKAYRYNPDKQTGTLLVEGKQGSYVSYVAVTISIDSDLVDFPGVLVSDRLALRGRRISGRYGNAYYDPNLSGDRRFTASAAPGESARPDYRNALWSGSWDGFNNDLVDGKIIACSMTPILPLAPPAGAPVTNIDRLEGNHSLSGVINTRYYRVKRVNLKNADTVTVDTTNGPVYIFTSPKMSLRCRVHLGLSISGKMASRPKPETCELSWWPNGKLISTIQPVFRTHLSTIVNRTYICKPQGVGVPAAIVSMASFGSRILSTLKIAPLPVLFPKKTMKLPEPQWA
ncbi:MAG: hypothetical protein ACFCU8_04450 [Thermosynechococcaceae cyanobacterium]